MNKKVSVYALSALFLLSQNSLLFGQTEAVPAITPERIVAPAAGVVTPEALPIVVIENKEITREAVAAEQDTNREEKLKQYCENLLFRILAEDTDTGDLPEAGFTVKSANSNLEKLLSIGEEGQKYVLSFLKEAKSGYIKERIVKELASKTGELDDRTLEALFAVIKDKSSQVRYLTVRMLGERGNKNAIPRINSLLYDSYSLRKDVYPVRIAAKEAIELIKLREEVAALASREEAAGKWIQVIRDKSAARQDYFCDKAVEELAFIPEAKELLWKELNSPAESQLKKNLSAKKTFAYFLLACSLHKDERALPYIEEALKDTSLMSIAAKAVSNISPSKGLNLLLQFSVESEKAELLYRALREVLLKEVTAPAGFLPERKETEEKYETLVKKILLLKRDFRAYRDAAEVYLYGMNDYLRAFSYLTLYENAGNQEGDEVFKEIKALCLAARGDLEAAGRLSFVLELPQYSANLRLLNLLSKKEKTPTTLFYKGEACFDIKAYRCAEEAYLEAVERSNDFTEAYAEKLRQKAAFCKSWIKEKIEDITAGLEKENEQGLILEISAEKASFRVGEEITIKMLFTNTGKSAVYGINDKEGRLGFDLIIMKNGELLKRLKKDLAKTIEIEELKSNMFVIEAGNGLSAEITALTREENTTEQEIVLSLSYVGGAAVLGPEKGWIKQAVLSNELKIEITK